MGYIKRSTIDETYCNKRKYGLFDIRNPVLFWKLYIQYWLLLLSGDRKPKKSILIPIIDKQIMKNNMLFLIGGLHIIILREYIVIPLIIKFFMYSKKQKLILKKREFMASAEKIKNYSYCVRLDTLTEHINVFMFFRKHNTDEFSEFIIIYKRKIIFIFIFYFILLK
ncbi:hypothetical protein DMUE_0993 [Dictyocoela muelleri]|nr:hypothetical protein DMUE_0993 [Dictyocoela muelleri]